MKCREIQDNLNQMFTAGGLELSQDMHAHLEACPDCREYYQSLVTLNQALAPLSEIALTAEETARLNQSLAAAVAEADRRVPQPIIRKIFGAFAPLALAAAAVVVLLMWSPWQNYAIRSSQTMTADDLQFDNIKSDDIISLTNGDTELLPTLVDEKTASYITEQVEPMQADEVLDKLSTDEVKWLNDNFSMEI